MSKRHWYARAGLIFLSLALVLILNPEMRAALVLVNSIGLDVLVLLIATQLRVTAPFLSPLAAWSLSAATAAGIYAYRSILPTLLSVLSPRHMPAPLVMLLFVCAALQLRMARGAKDEAGKT